MNVLIGYSCCPLTRAAFQSEGHLAVTCDLLPPRDGSIFHIAGDVWKAIAGHPWHFGVFHPMCTYLTVSAAWAYSDPDFERYPGVGYHQRVQEGTLTGKARRDQRDVEIENFRRLLELPFPAVIENPAVSFINKALRPPTQIVQPYEYGDNASKVTGLWHNDVALRCGLPLLVPTQRIAPRMVNGKPRWANQTDSGQNNLGPSAARWLKRSETYPGIAAALGKTYGSWLHA